MTDAALEKRMDRRDKEVTSEFKNLWSAMDKLRDQYDTLKDRLQRLPAWGVVIVSTLTLIIGVMGGWIAKGIGN